MTDSCPSVHVDRENSGCVPDPAGGQRTRETFDTLWSFETDGPLRASPIVSDERVVVGDMDGVVYACDAIDGREHWRTDLDAPSVFASPTVADGTVFVSGYDDLNRAQTTTYALDMATGAVQWARDFGQGGRTAVTADDDRVYVPTYDGVVRALSARSGETVWRLDGERWTKTPALTAGTVILGDGDELVSLDGEAGIERWRTALNGHVQTPPVVDAGRVYVVCRSDEQWCLDSATGETLWRVDIGAAIRDHSGTGDPLVSLGGGILDSKPVTDGESLLVGIYEGLVELDAVDGRLLNYHPLGRRLHDPLLVGGDGDRRLYGHVRTDGMAELRLTTTGASSLRSTAADALDTVPAYAAGVLYFGTETGSVRAVC